MVRKWWTQWPDANIGVAVPADRFVLDVDGEAGQAALRQAGIALNSGAPRVRTGSGGIQVWFRVSREVRPRVGLLPGVDLRGPGSYVVVPPSLHKSGRHYTWEVPLDGEIPEAPEALLALIDTKVSRAAEGSYGGAELIPQGTRNETLTSLAGTMRVRGMERDEIAAALQAVNRRRCSPPLLEDEVERIAASVAQYAPANATSKGERRHAQIAPWPAALAAEAFHGLAGDIVRAIEPHSEADPVALLLQLLDAVGNMVGREPHFIAEDDRHGLNLFAVLVGETSKGRKGAAWGRVHRPLSLVDPQWAASGIQSGLSSGEGLIWAVRDPIERRDPIKEQGHVVSYETVVADPGVTDKRLLVLESEFSRTLRVMDRDGNTLSPVIRQAWDTGTLRVLTKTTPARATDAHISIIGHVTRDELRRYLTSTEAGNGFANRFLWICVRRSKVLPEGGSRESAEVIARLVDNLKAAVRFGQSVGEIKCDDRAREIWQNVYPNLSEGRPGLHGAVTSRAEAQVMRLACVYAVLDRSALVREEHLLAALAAWDYADESCRYIFGQLLGDPVADRVLEDLVAACLAGRTRTEVSALLGRNIREDLIDRALGTLRSRNLALPRFENPSGRGRPTERWFATSAVSDARIAAV